MPVFNPQLIRDNARERIRVLNAAAGATFTDATLMPNPPAVAGAAGVVAVERAHIEGGSTARNARTDVRPFLREVMAAGRFGPAPALPTADQAEAQRAAQREALTKSILSINESLSGHRRAELETLRDTLTKQLHAVGGR